MRVLIIPSKDRPATILLTILYNRAGYEVVYPTRESWGDDLCDICVWPVAFMTNNETGRRVLCDLSLPLHFGEDSFLLDSNVSQFSNVGHPDARVTFEDINVTGRTIDIFHTTREHIGRLDEIVKRASCLMPNARWISSTLSDYDHNPFRMSPDNVCRILPASYSSAAYKNTFDLVSSSHLKRFYGIKDVERVGFASFNHNYSARQPREYQIFDSLNKRMSSEGFCEIPNFGGNTRGQGADIRFTQTGSGFTTLNPLQAAQKNASILAAIHLKSNDWGGGVPIICIATGTPIVITSQYAKKTNATDILIDGFNAVYVDSVDDLYEILKNGQDFWKQMSDNMNSLCKKIDLTLDEKWIDFVVRSQHCRSS